MGNGIKKQNAWKILSTEIAKMEKKIIKDEAMEIQPSEKTKQQVKKTRKNKEKHNA